MVKQASQTCKCSKLMEFPEGEVKTVCKCGAVWELGVFGYWYVKVPGPLLPRHHKPSHYERYMAWRKGVTR